MEMQVPPLEVLLRFLRVLRAVDLPRAHFRHGPATLRLTRRDFPRLRHLRLAILLSFHYESKLPRYA